MSIHVLGTAAADGWPNPFCRCASCAAERSAGRVRSQTSVLVDGRVLLDCGPGTPEAAERAGLDLTEVDLIAFTHAHSDHFSPAVLMHRSWVSDRPLTVVGPPGVVAACRSWLPPEARVRWVQAQPGDLVEHHEYALQVLASTHTTHLGEPGVADSVLYDLITADGDRVLFATDTGPLPDATVEAVEGASFDVVLLEETFGDREDLAGTGHLGLRGFGEQVDRLRSVGAITEQTQVVAIHLSHHNPPFDELQDRLAPLGARAALDAEVLSPPGRR